jgi:hypothetical protein
MVFLAFFAPLRETFFPTSSGLSGYPVRSFYVFFCCPNGLRLSLGPQASLLAAGL